MARRIMISVFMVLVVGSSLALASARARVRDCSVAGEPTQARKRRYGPYATIRRANEVANQYRRGGYNAQVIYAGTLEFREYYVDVW